VNRLLIVSALRAERIALAGAVRDATVASCGMGLARVDRWLLALVGIGSDAIIVAGVAGATDPSLRSGMWWSSRGSATTAAGSCCGRPGFWFITVR
jgi:hypothetical protein